MVTSSESIAPEFNYQIVGESFARDGLIQLIRGHESLGEILCEAQLVREPENTFDPNAVMVMIDGIRVGYIPKHDSATATRLIEDSEISEYLVPARIGWDADNPMPLIGVTISFNL